MSADLNLKPEDYLEPECPLCMNNETKPIDTRRFISKLDEYFDKNDLKGAQRHLEYWYSEAKSGNDARGLFTVLNEMLGLYRKTNQREKALDAIEELTGVTNSLGIDDTVGAATSYINIGTVYKTFEMAETALPYFEKARVIYEKELKESDPRLGGLYNNEALALSDLGRYDEAMELYNKALNVVQKNDNSGLEAAITYLNMANTAEAKYGLEAAEEYIDVYLMLAQENIDDEKLERNGYYAFVCEKCAPTFAYYGRFAYAEELKKRAEEIYERN